MSDISFNPLFLRVSAVPTVQPRGLAFTTEAQDVTTYMVDLEALADRLAKNTETHKNSYGSKEYADIEKDLRRALRSIIGADVAGAND